VTSKYWKYQWLWGRLDWFSPPVCGGCDRGGYRWCPDRQGRIQIIKEPVCRLCGRLLYRSGQCHSCIESSPSNHAMSSGSIFEGPIRRAFLKRKSRWITVLGDALAKPQAMVGKLLDWPVEVVVPVPLGKAPLKDRCKNQVELVARRLANYPHWHYAHLLSEPAKPGLRLS
jgi:competence protein ComFC